MTPQELAVIKAMKAFKRAYNALEHARAVLQDKGCTHPAAHLREFTWEHDNGYGVQSTLKGVECALCHAQNRWGTWAPKKEWDEWDR